MKKTLIKIKEFFAKVWRWIVALLKRTKFDNQLFAIGVNKVREVVLEKYEGTLTTSLEGIKLQIREELEEKFKKVSPVTKKLLDEVLKYAEEKAINIKVFSKANIKKYINSSFDAIVSWYDSKF